MQINLRPTEYEIRLYNHIGQLQHIFDSYRSLDYNLKINDVNDMTLTLEYDQAIYDALVVDSLCEVRRNIGFGWYTEDWFFMRTPQVQLTTTGSKILTCYMRGLLDLIDRRWLAYTPRPTANVVNDPVNKAGHTDDIIKEYVNENAGTLATLGNGRLRAGTLVNFTVSPANGLGPFWFGSRSYKSLLSTIQEIGHTVDPSTIDQHNYVDFNIIYDLGTRQFLFQTYYPQLGVDRSNTIVFDPNFNNVTDLSYTKSRAEEVNAVIVNGPDNQATHTTTHAVLENARKYDSPWNDRETIVDSRNQDTNDALTSIAQKTLSDLGLQESYAFTPIFNVNAQYGQDFFLGDKVAIRFLGFEVIKKIVQVHINMSEGKEQVQLTFGDFQAPVQTYADAIKILVTRIQDLQSVV